MKKTIKVMFLLMFPAVIVLVAVIYNQRKISRNVAGVQTSLETGTVRGLILPHHKLADEFIIKSLENIKQENYSHIVIFGPNHYSPETGLLITADKVFDCEIRNEVLDGLLYKYPDILVSDKLIEDEHSITLHLPYIEEFFPEAKVIPFMVSPLANKDDLYEKIDYLVSLLPIDTLYIASVDFAHNELQDTALQKNEESIDAIKNFDFSTIYGFEEDHMDSPVSIAMLLKAMKQLNAITWETLHSTHASLIEDDPTSQGTGYVIGVFR